MPLIKIELPVDLCESYSMVISDLIQRTLIEHFNVSTQDKFHIFSAHTSTQMLMHRQRTEMPQNNHWCFIQVICNHGRTTEMKKHFYQTLSQAIENATSIKKQHVIINILEVAPENWSFGIV